MKHFATGESLKVNRLNISLFGGLFALHLNTELRQRTSFVSSDQLARHKGTKLLTKNKTT